MCLSVLDLANKHPNVKKFFNSPGIFDGLVSVLVQEMRKGPMRPHLCDPLARGFVIEMLVSKIMKVLADKNLVVHDFAEVV